MHLFDDFATLLEYPAAPLADACSSAIAGCGSACPAAVAQLEPFATAVHSTPLAGLQEVYARTFDFDAETALYVGHHLFGEEGRRGLLIAGLVERYGRLGLETGAELADHFSPVLRSLALDGDTEEAHELVRLAIRPAVAKVLPNVERRAAAYAGVLHALALVLDRHTGEPFELESDRCRPSSSPYFLTLLS